MRRETSEAVREKVAQLEHSHQQITLAIQR